MVVTVLRSRWLMATCAGREQIDGTDLAGFHSPADPTPLSSCHRCQRRFSVSLTAWSGMECRQTFALSVVLHNANRAPTV